METNEFESLVNETVDTEAKEAFHQRSQKLIREYIEYQSKFTYLGNYSAVEPVYSRYMQCEDCFVSWHGCWDNFQCPKCGQGELPNNDFPVFLT